MATKRLFLWHPVTSGIVLFFTSTTNFHLKQKYSIGKCKTKSNTLNYLLNYWNVIWSKMFIFKIKSRSSRVNVHWSVYWVSKFKKVMDPDYFFNYKKTNIFFNFSSQTNKQINANIGFWWGYEILLLQKIFLLWQKKIWLNKTFIANTTLAQI